MNQTTRRSPKYDPSSKSKSTPTTQVPFDFAMDKPTKITRQYLRDITSRIYKNPVISIYLRFGPDKHGSEPKSYLSVINSLKAQEMKRRNKYLSGLEHSQDKALKGDLEFVEKVLDQKITGEGFCSLVIIKSGDDIQLIAKLPLDIDEDIFVIDSNPYTSLLTAMLQEQKKVMVVKITKDHTNFSMYNLGSVEEIHVIDPELPDPDAVKTRPEKKQSHELDHLNHHFKECGDYLYKQASAQAFDFLIVIGHEDITTKKFINTLHPDVKKRLLNEANISPIGLDKNTIPNLVTEALENYQLNMENVDEAELSQAKGQHIIIEGIEQVLSAHNRGLLRELYVQSTYQVDGYICPTRHYISLTDGKPCPICEAKLQQTKNCVDELIEQSTVNGIVLHLFTKRPEIMDAYQKIAAVTYPPTT